MQIVILPGNGGCRIQTHHWYGWVSEKLRANGYKVIADDMPDAELARKRI